MISFTVIVVSFIRFCFSINPSLTTISDSQRLRIPTTTRHIHDALALERRHIHGHILVLAVAMAQAPIVTAAPCVQLATICDGRRVGTAACYVNHLLAL